MFAASAPPIWRGVDLDAYAGEVLGISGLIGSGMEQLGSAVFGAIPAEGSVQVDDAVVPRLRPQRSIRAGVAFVPADRRERGSIGAFVARENITLPRMSDLRSGWGAISARRERRDVDEWMTRVRVLPSGFAEQRFDLFSGGNQQKIVLAKWLRLHPRVLLLDEPTQGVDAGAQAEIYELLAQAARDGAAVIVSSSDTKELAAICDRVVVLREGRVVGEFDRAALSETALVRAVIDESTPPIETRTA